MDIGTVAGLVVAIVALALGVVLGGGNPVALIDLPSIAVVFGGTFGAILASFPLARVTKLHAVVLKSVFSKPVDPVGTITDLVRYAEIARREGILALENLVPEMKDDFIVRGIKMAVDGTDPELINQIMETELEAIIDRHAQGKQILDTTGRYAPAYGMIGTLLGLIFMLSNMDDPSKIGPGMAVALITTLYGAIIANMVTGPMGDKLQARDGEEVLVKTIVIAGVMAIQSGDNPRVVESKLMTYLPPGVRAAMDAGKESAAA
ncbi:MAG: motility protein A [Leptolyngbya sp. PLA3]|nr:MAG: motility protein A [Cyanobacteria bacterium CYA]MCE7968872.1 motility protein A [Leptolyngbya sp. PL-A3]